MVDIEDFKGWAPSAQEKALEMLEDAEKSGWRPFYCSKPHCDGKEHDEWNFRHARANQHPPKGVDWMVWLNRGGRGSGKTRTGSEWTHRRTKVSPRIALVAQTLPDARETMVDGESGLLATARPGEYPHYEPSKRKLTWPNGAMAFIFTAEEPDRLRGPQFYDAWLDEPAHMVNIEEVWSNLLFGLRLGKAPKICATTTPKPTDWMKALIADPLTVSVVASTYANIDNLAPVFATHVLSKYENTRIGRQEIYGEILADVDGALWSFEMIEDNRREAPDRFDRIVVAVDPAGSSRKDSNKTGIIVVGVLGDDFYVLDDFSGVYTPAAWAKAILRAYERYSADAVVAEINYGGEMVEDIVAREAKEQGLVVHFKPVTSRRGKVIRADPIVALTERQKVHFTKKLKDLVDQLISWVPGEESPDRLDAMVHGITDLAKIASPTSIAIPKQAGGRMGRGLQPGSVVDLAAYRGLGRAG